MEANEASKHRKREYVVVKHGQTYYYARLNRTNPDQYDVMANVSQKEGMEIVEKANAGSEFNREADKS